jgi:hypothetical protein
MANNEDIEVETGGLGLRLTPRFVLQLLMYVAILATAWFSLDKRITTLEVRSTQIYEDLKELKSDIKLLLQRTARP